MSTDVQLNPDELFHLAILDSRSGRHDEAIVKLKGCIATDPSFAGAHHMLAAEHAEIGMYREAIRELDHALVLDPKSVAARFQLGLLHMITNDPQQARLDWAPLDKLDPAGPWSAFKGALEGLMDQDALAALRQLDKGLAMDFSNAALRADMSKLRERIQVTAKASSQIQPQAGEMLLKTYRGSGDSNA